MTNFQAPDLTLHPPRSPRVTLGGFVHLPRLLDKARACCIGKNADYFYPCPMDQRLLDFVGIDPDLFLETVKAGKSDSEMLAWLLENMTTPRRPHEIIEWSRWMTNAAPGDADRHERFAGEIKRMAPQRTDIVTTFDRLDLDDYTSFGGRG